MGAVGAPSRVRVAVRCDAVRNVQVGEAMSPLLRMTVRVLAFTALIMWSTEAVAQDPAPVEEPAVEPAPIDFFGDMSDVECQKFLDAEGDLQLIKRNKKAPYYGVLLTYTGFEHLWAEYQQGLVDIGAANEHIKVLEELVDTLQGNHKDDLLKCKDDCDARVGHCLDNYPQPVVIPCEPCVMEWYENPALWVSVGLVVGVVVGGGTVYLFGD